MMRQYIYDSTPFHGGDDYTLPEVPSPHVASAGMRFLSRHVVDPVVAPNLMDLGCWSGRHIPVLLNVKQKKHHVIGVDHPWTIGKRIKRARKKHSAASFRTSEFHELDVAKKSVAGASCWRVLHNLYLPEHMLEVVKELYRVLAVNAPLVIAVRFPTKEMHKQGIVARKYSMPQAVRTITGVNDRQDLYFTKPAVHSVFGDHFVIDKCKKITEEERIGNTDISNRYLAVHMRRRRDNNE